MNMFDYPVFDFPFPGIIFGGSNSEFLFPRGICSGVRISKFECCFWQIIFSSVRISNLFLGEITIPSFEGGLWAAKLLKNRVFHFFRGPAGAEIFENRVF